jgi:hypothetical protein
MHVFSEGFYSSNPLLKVMNKFNLSSVVLQAEF